MAEKNSIDSDIFLDCMEDSGISIQHRNRYSQQFSTTLTSLPFDGDKNNHTSLAINCIVINNAF